MVGGDPVRAMLMDHLHAGRFRLLVEIQRKQSDGNRVDILFHGQRHSTRNRLEVQATTSDVQMTGYEVVEGGRGRSCRGRPAFHPPETA